jgi:uncharacterized membrane protein YeaQ/YmgE (transglycosylase-associated protein family)
MNFIISLENIFSYILVKCYASWRMLQIKYLDADEACNFCYTTFLYDSLFLIKLTNFNLIFLYISSYNGSKRIDIQFALQLLVYTSLRSLYDICSVAIRWDMEWLAGWLTDWLADWLSDWVTGWLTEWLTGWLTDWLTEWLSDWVTGWLTDWLYGWLTEWLAGWLIDWPSEWLAGWVTEWLAGWLTGWLAGWLTEWLAGWLTEWLTD